ncbi:MAG: hypothetical protein Ta2D_09200 [Rickettsiales bacterium]|nr:MAG: hypothetical protein Ta2D_09200 [Rickettsiales bacterium]
MSINIIPNTIYKITDLKKGFLGKYIIEQKSGYKSFYLHQIDTKKNIKKILFSLSVNPVAPRENTYISILIQRIFNNFKEQGGALNG